MTKEQKQATISALMHERSGYEMWVVKAQEDEDAEALEKWQGRIGQVDAELRKLGAKAEKTTARAERRPRQSSAETR